MKYNVAINQLLSAAIRYVKLIPVATPLLYRAGQYVSFKLQQEMLHFSIANAPVVEGYLEFYLRETSDDPLLRELVAHMAQYGEVELEGPYGNCIYRADGKPHVVLLAGGVGIGQCKGLLEQAINELDARDFHLYWSVSARNDVFLMEQLAEWQQQLQQFNYTIIFTREIPLLSTHERYGLAQTEILRDFPDLTACALYSCGPWELTDKALPILREHGLMSLYTYSDRFAFA